MSKREISSLVRLAASGSAARTFNLIAVMIKHGGSAPYGNAPVFRSRALNRSIIVKHRLRPNEVELFPGRRESATKVIIPLQVNDLKLGARSFFINQRGYDRVFEELEIVEGDLRHDQKILNILDSLPSLDPFLMREKFKVSGFTPARCYFDLSDADAKAMFEVVREELRPLLSLSFDDLDARIDEKTAQLAEKILENASAAELEPLRLGLGMTPQEFSEGIFCWKGFIYYKWRLNGLMANVAPVAAEILRVNTTDPMSFDQKGYIEGARDRLDKSIGQVCRIVKQTLNIYDAAYRDLTVNGNPLAFKEFLLKAPKMFNELGERLGAVDHILSFWRYRFPLGASAKVTTEELHELFVDFENSLSFKAVA